MRWLRQLLPLHYCTGYFTPEGDAHFVTWRMWFGRCLRVKDVVLSG